MGHRHLPRLFAVVAASAGLVVAQPAWAQDADAIAITMIDLTTDTVEITNNGSADLDPNGIILCNFPDYAPIAGADPIAPGASITVDAAALGVELGDDEGELGLYTASEFENPEAIVAYVEWGTADHRRSSVAVDAGIWDGTPVDAGAQLEATVDAPTSSGEWAAIGAPAAQDTDSDDGDGEATVALPETGAATVIMSLIAVGLIAVGAGLAVAGRRGRIAGP